MNVEELEAKLEELTRECDDRRRRCAMLARAHGALADAGCIVPTEMDETIEHAIEALAKERDAANAKHETLSALVEGYRRERDEARAEVDRLRETIKLMWSSCGCCKCTVCTLSKDALHKKKGKSR